ncbi:RidA family protein [Bogoriella caseilytica]|uniref:Reactive intermediate/imine deaminase n=1 Tax=Bogoriella caseilytica TaxID=56055 RepID=A0A3N2BA64_9MICO|nr:RidA family protein [Bogoriella caseilytica]ROR72042.1 reactive intermediate/imine deaminase [Bogoriella caseilytica]
MTDKQAVTTSRAPSPAAAFSQGVKKGGILQVSGQGPQDPGTGEYLFEGDVAAQTTRTLENVRGIVEASGASFEDVVSLRVFLTDREHFSAMNEAYNAFVREHVPSGIFPARTTIFVGLPRPEMLVEIDGLASV